LCSMRASTGMEHNELAKMSQGSLGPNVPLKSASIRPARKSGAILVMRKSSPTSPSMERTVFHGFEV